MMVPALCRKSQPRSNIRCSDHARRGPLVSGHLHHERRRRAAQQGPLQHQGDAAAATTMPDQVHREEGQALEPEQPAQESAGRG